MCTIPFSPNLLLRCYDCSVVSIISTWRACSPSHKVARVELNTHLAYFAHGLSTMNSMSNLDIYRSLMPPL